jgi:RNA polymerase sigma-70 factor (ECF subfamily)
MPGSARAAGPERSVFGGRVAAVRSTGRASQADARDARETLATRNLYVRYADQVFGYCLRQLGSREDAEDAVQSTYLNAFRDLKRGTVPASEAAWLFRIAQNVCRSRRRSSWRRGRIESPADFALVEERTQAPARRGDELIGLQDVLEQLPDGQRRAILLREWQGLSYREIADDLEVSQAAVETLIFRARRSLAQGLETPPPRRRRGVLRGIDAGGVAAGLKPALVGGSAAAKVAATVAVVGATSVVATAPLRDRHSWPPAPAPAPAVATATPRAKVESGRRGVETHASVAASAAPAPVRVVQGRPSAVHRASRRPPVERARSTAPSAAATTIVPSPSAPAIHEVQRPRPVRVSEPVRTHEVRHLAHASRPHPASPHARDGNGPPSSPRAAPRPQPPRSLAGEHESNGKRRLDSLNAGASTTSSRAEGHGAPVGHGSPVGHGNDAGHGNGNGKR